jgi:hypothetical protein
MENDYDDISSIKFRDSTAKDQASNDRLVMKYFGSKIKTQPDRVEKFTSPRWNIFRPLALASVITGLMIISKWSVISNMLAFTQREFINQIILYGMFFAIVLACIFITYSNR